MSAEANILRVPDEKLTDPEALEWGWIDVGRSRAPAIVAALVAVGTAAGAAAIVLTGGVMRYPTAFAIVVVTDVLGFTLAGVMWLRARPESPYGRYLLGLAAFSALASLSGLSQPWLYVVGIVFGWALAIGFTGAAVTFPNGRLDRWSGAIVGFAVAVFVVLEVPQLLLNETLVASSPLGRCAGPDCPTNPLVVVSHPVTTHGLTVAAGVGRTVWGVAAAVYLGVVVARTSRPRRRIIMPVYAVTLLLAGAFAASAISADVLGAGSAPAWVRDPFIAVRLLIPLAFVASIVLARANAGTALATMARELGAGPSVGAIESLVRRVLHDPQARLGFWLPREGHFVDRHGRRLALSQANEGRSWRAFGHGGENVLAIEHDPGLADDAELVDAVGAATMIALDNRRLQQNLLDSIDALRASQRRLVTAGAAERRKIERDLHDSTQQKLVAIRIQLELAREQAPLNSGLRRRLAALGDELDDAIDELRVFAHGIYPPLLSDEGLAVALREAATRSRLAIQMRIGEIGRLPEAYEEAIYYCCLEALQNVAKHAGRDAQAVLTLRRQGRLVQFSVSDDGVGFDVRDGAHGEGLGLTGMSDRIGGLGGSLAVHSAPGQGTIVEGSALVPREQGDHDARD